MGTQSTDFSAVDAGLYQNGAPLRLEAERTATWTLVGDLDADSEVYLERSTNLITWEVVQTFLEGALDESGTITGPYHYRFRLANLGLTDQTDPLDATIADAVDTLHEWKNNQGVVVFRITEEGIETPKVTAEDVAASDDQTIAGDLTVEGALKIADSNASHHITFVPGDEAADRELGIPVLGGADTMMTLGTAQTVTGQKTLTAPILTSPALSNPTFSGTPVGTITYDPGAIAINNLRVASDVVSEETVTIGADVYEIEIVNTDSTDDTAAGNSFNNTTNPLVLATFTTSYPATTMAIGDLLRVENEIMVCTASSAGSRTFARGQFGTTTATHADASDMFIGDGVTPGSIPVGMVATLTPAVFTPALTAAVNAYGTEAITAVNIGAEEVLLKADAVGAVTTACTETLGGANNGFRAANMAGGRAQGVSKLSIQKRVPVAVEVALDHMHFQFDFTPTLVQVFVIVTATPGVAVAWDGGVTISSGLVTIDNGAAADWTASHTVVVLAQA